MTRATTLLLVAALSGCSLAPNYVRPTPPVSTSWPAGDAYLAQSETGLPLVSYREVFRDPRLQGLVEQALANNRDIRIAAAKLAAARAQVRVVRAAQFPQVGGSASSAVSNGGSNSASSSGNGSFSLGVGVTNFEIDLFGRLANATAAQRERALSTEAAARTVRLALVADLADAWAAAAADRELLVIAGQTATAARDSVRLTRARLEGGVAPRTDLRQAEQVLATAEGDVAVQTTALAQDANLARLLIGAEFDPAALPATLDEAIRSIDALPAGLSSQVLLRRPDVVDAEYQLRAANADIGVARAQLFPVISLTGLLGLASNSLTGLFGGGAFRASGGADLNVPIFDAGGRRANVAVTQAQRDAALAAYERAIQIAFREVADALADQGTIAERQRTARLNTTAAADTERLTEARYRGGVDSYLASLDAQRSLYAAQRAEVATRLALVRNRIQLYRTLGGDQTTATTPQ